MKKRIVSLILSFSLVFSLLSARLFSIATDSEYANAQKSLFTRSIDNKRGFIYDRNFQPLVNNETKKIICVKPTEDGYEVLKALKGKNFADETLGKGYFTTTQIDNSVKIKASESYRIFDCFERYGSSSALHLIGYLNSEGDGVCGIEKYFNTDLKKESGSLSLGYRASATGKMLINEPVEIRDNNYYSSGGIALTIDKEIQKITEKALANGNIDKGAAIILNPKTFEIIACASTPVFNRERLEEHLNDTDSPFINRAFTAFPIGSVFKPLTAAAAFENGITLPEFNCSGKIEKSNNLFRCNKKEGHGLLNFNEALSLSCNPYFIELGTKTGGEKILELARNFGFGKSTDLGNGFFTDSGALPDKKMLNSDAATGNFAFGQGYLSATPLQIAACFSVFANGGFYKEPSVIYGKVNSEGAFQKEEEGAPKRILSEVTCEKINAGLLMTAVSGTGTDAFSSLFSSCSETATAQSGQYNGDGTEIKYCWFVGFFPAENPKYTICILKENGSSGGSDGAPVFKEIAENILKIYS